MQQTFRINTGSLNANFIESVKAMFGNTDVKIVIEDLKQENPISQKEQFKKTEKLRLKLKGIKVDPNLNLSDLANEMNL